MSDLRLANGTGGLDWSGHREIGLARSESTVETALSPIPVDLLGSTITFDVPDDLDVWVLCRVPYLRCARMGALAIVELTDGAGHVFDAAGLRAAVRHDCGFLCLDELIPAGSGRVVRKLRGRTTKGRGVVNGDGRGRVTMDACIR